jgi:hypothetical protein
MLLWFRRKKIQSQYKIPANKSINATGLMFEDENSIFLKIFYTDSGLLFHTHNE